MKKFFVIALFLGGILTSGVAFAGNTDEPGVNTDLLTKNGQSTAEEKKKSKYTFTLFTFFKPEEQNTKVDSSSTKTSPVQPKIKEKVSSNL